MHPFKHILLTIVLFLFIRFFYNLNFSILFYSVILTLTIDVIDHSIAIFIYKNKLSQNTKKLIKRKAIIRAFRYYYNNRREKFKYLLLHNLITFYISLYSSLLFFSNNFYRYNISLYMWPFWMLAKKRSWFLDLWLERVIKRYFTNIENYISNSCIYQHFRLYYFKTTFVV